MKNKLQLLVEKLTSNVIRLFLADSLGAFLTAFLLLAFISRFEEKFGMPERVVYFLSAIAVLYGIYSLCCYKFVKENWRPFLRAISIANTLYSVLTTILLINYASTMKTLGFTYFIFEIMIICLLAFVEWRTAAFKYKNGKN